MIRHIAVFRWKPDTTPAAVDALTAGLAALPGAIPEIETYRFGPDEGFTETNWDYAVVAEFADKAAYETYRDHPEHQELIDELIAPIIAERAAIQQDDAS